MFRDQIKSVSRDNSLTRTLPLPAMMDGGGRVGSRCTLQPEREPKPDYQRTPFPVRSVCDWWNGPGAERCLLHSNPCPASPDRPLPHLQSAFPGIFALIVPADCNTSVPRKLFKRKLNLPALWSELSGPASSTHLPYHPPRSTPSTHPRRPPARLPQCF